MDNSTVLRDAGLTLKQFFGTYLSDFLSEEDISFDSPADIPSGDITRLSVFLFQVSPNPYLRNQEQEAIGDNKLRPLPAVVDLKYLFTPYAQKRETELILIERIVQLFHDFAVTLKGFELQGCLKDSGNDPIHIEPLDLSLDDMNKLWGIFPNKPFKVSLCYMLTAIKLPSIKSDRSISRVIERRIDLHRKEKP